MPNLHNKLVTLRSGQNDAVDIQPVLEAVAQLVASRKEQVEDELRTRGRSMLARMVRKLPSSNSEQLERIALKDLPIASNALALAAASSCVLHATQQRFEDACRSADVALIMMGIPIGQPLLDFITLLEQNSLLKYSPFIPEGSGFDEVNERKHIMMKNMDRKCAEIDEENCDLEQFARFFKKDKPVVIRRHALSWPCMQKWCDPTYLGNLYGHRTVPVEYTSSTGRMEEKFSSIAEVITFMTQKTDTEYQEEVYMAQHPILNYVPTLREDVKTPEYLKVVDKTKADLVNMWMGSSGTGTKLHFDSADNILVQLVGSKQLVLIEPDQSHLLYQATLKDNISPVDITEPDLARFPRFAEVRGTTIKLEPGDAVYIPAQHWHWVRAISSSISINYWF
ncbi:Cupin-like protein [Gracilaria domingensis]|nr:Cupin-like protein [Gracilaria domingensis]